MVPAAQFLSVTYNLKIVMVILPLLIIIMVLLFLSEYNSIMRCGQYIRTNLEPLVPDLTGWETWLETTNKHLEPRLADKYMVYGFYLLSGIYYFISIYLAANATQEIFGASGKVIILWVYITLGIWTGAFLGRRIRISTQ